MSAWTAAAFVLLLSLAPLGLVLLRGSDADALVALELASTVVVLVLVLLAEAFSRPSYLVAALALAPLQAVGSLLYARFLPARS